MGIPEKWAFALVGGLMAITIIFAFAQIRPRGSADATSLSATTDAQSNPAQPPAAPVVLAALPDVTPIDPVLGRADAPVTIIAYENLTCPHCAEGFGSLLSMRQKFPDDVRIIWKDFPGGHFVPEMSQIAHEAARCAHAHGKFWEYVGTLFSQSYILQNTLYETAEAVGIPSEAFNECVSSRRYKDIVQRLYEDAAARGIDGTPTYFVNGARLNGTPSDEYFEQIIREKLGQL